MPARISPMYIPDVSASSDVVTLKEGRTPVRFDLVAYHPPDDPGRALVGRVVGLPREEVEILPGGVLRINQQVVEEPFEQTKATYLWEVQLGSDTYAILGDNRPNSDDSHSRGPVPRDSIIASGSAPER